MEKGSSSSSSSGGGGGGAESLNGLKFGKKIYFEVVGSGLPEEAAAAPLRSPAKKGRTAVAQGGQPPRCQVEGCRVDLSDAKAYYCRHKVCCMHSKFPKVIVAGLEQRFCQQCSRFHQLPEFDQGKRSCRRRLAGHNERRRKPPPDPFLSSRYATLSPSPFDNGSKMGGFLRDFSAYSAFSGRDSWLNSAERGLANQTTLPWQSSSQAPLPDLPAARHGYSGPGLSSSGDCLGGASGSTSALSLLSNTNGFDPNASVGQFACPSWDLKGNQANTSLHEIELAQISHSSSSEHGRDIRLAQSDDARYHELEPPGGYDSSVPHVNWSR